MKALIKKDDILYKLQPLTCSIFPCIGECMSACKDSERCLNLLNTLY